MPSNPYLSTDKDVLREENMTHDEEVSVLGMGNRLSTSSNCPDCISTWYKRRLAAQFGFAEGTAHHEDALNLISTVFKITKDHYAK